MHSTPEADGLVDPSAELLERAQERMAAELLSVLPADLAKERAAQIAQGLADAHAVPITVASSCLNPKLLAHGVPFERRVTVISRVVAAWRRACAEEPPKEAEKEPRPCRLQWHHEVDSGSGFVAEIVVRAPERLDRRTRELCQIAAHTLMDASAVWVARKSPRCEWCDAPTEELTPMRDPSPEACTEDQIDVCADCEPRVERELEARFGPVDPYAELGLSRGDF